MIRRSRKKFRDETLQIDTEAVSHVDVQHITPIVLSHPHTAKTTNSMDEGQPFTPGMPY